MKTGMILSVAALAATSGSALAGTAVVDAIGGEVVMQSGSVSGVFSTSSPDFSNADLLALHSALNSDGVATDGWVTAMLLETDADTLAWVVLVDELMADRGGVTFDNSLEMSTTGNASHMEFINDDGSDITEVFAPGSTRTLAGFFTWDSGDHGDGFAWDKLLRGDTFTFDFTKDTGDFDTDINGFQFVSFVGGAWDVVADGDFSQTSSGNPPQFSYSVEIVPTPQIAMLGIAGLTGLGVIRRRKLG